MIGRTLSHYEIVEKLGHGGMGEVYRAVDSKLKRSVALKVLPAELSDHPERLARFQREAETVAALNHPNIVTLYSVEEADGVHFLTMELVEGRDLDEVIPATGLTLERIFELAIPLADALASAHDRGIIHRDVKPANVMVTDEGRVKVLDFGLAKLLDSSTDEGLHTEDATQALTEEGKVMGTVPYMSPEQVQGKPLDARSDVFSLGIILYEMATGGRPFAGETSADLISSILRDTPDSVTELKGELPHHLGRIVRHCLEKDPKRRYQTALDVRNELEDLKREIDTGTVHSETVVLESARSPAGASKRWVVPAALAALLSLVGWGAWQIFAPRVATSPESASETAAIIETEPGQPSIAVLFFDNLSGDEDLDWLREGLTDMLVTDLSQSPDLRVLSTDRVYQILSDLGKLDERITSFEVVREVAHQARADTVILGSFAKLGDTIRISIKIQEADTGEIVTAHNVDAKIHDDLFARVDDLSRNIRQSIRLPEQPAASADRDLTEVSTSSVEAYRAFVEAEKLHYESREQEALELYRRATEIDPEFAMAWAKLSTTHGNLGMQAESIEYAERAMEHLDRLTAPERAYVEGRYYGRTLATYELAIETYSGTLERYPHLSSLANNLGVIYNSLWMFEEAIESYELAIRYGDRFPGTYTGLSAAYFSAERSERALEVLDRFLQETPNAVSVLQQKGNLNLALGNTEAARSFTERAREIRPNWFPLLFDEIALAIVDEDWEEARRLLDQVGELPFPFARSAELGVGAMLDLYRGRFDAALAKAEASVEAWPEPGSGRANSHLAAANAHVEVGDPERALEHARAAREQARGSWTDFLAHGWEVLAHQGLGQSRRADLSLAELERRAEDLPGSGPDAWVTYFRGRLATEQGREEDATRELERALERAPHLSRAQTTFRFELGRAQLRAERWAAATAELREIVELGGARVFNAPEWVMSHYLLGRALEGSGETAEAKQLYARFLEYWGEADRFAPEVEHARAFLSSS